MHETLPIIDKAYFPVTISQLLTEIDNAAPSATYKHKNTQKVDIFYNNSYYAYSNSLDSSMETMINSLRSSGYNLDVRFIQCDTNGIRVDTVPYQYRTIKTVGSGDLGISGNGAARKYLSGDIFNTKIDIMQMASDGLDAVSLVTAMAHLEDRITGEWIGKNDQRWENVLGWRMHVGNIGVSTSGIVDIKLNRADRTMTISGEGISDTTVSMQNLTIKTETVSSGFIGEGLSGYGVKCTIGTWVDETGYREEEVKIPTTFDASFDSMSWRSDALKFAIYANHDIPEAYIDIENNTKFMSEYSVLSAKSIYYTGIGSNNNMDYFNSAVNMLRNTVIGDSKSAMCINGQSDTFNGVNTTVKNFILSKLSDEAKPSNYILVGQDVVWETQYDDSEHDVPLNFGANKFDIDITKKWGIVLTNRNPSAKLTAERWRFIQHLKYDNSLGLEGYSNTWIEQAPTNFLKPGLYRVNYKRRDNPIYPSISDSDAFANYRYWSNDYDIKVGA